MRMQPTLKSCEDSGCWSGETNGIFLCYSCLGTRGIVSEMKVRILSSGRPYREYLSCSSHGYVLSTGKKYCVDSCFFQLAKSHAEWVSVIQCSQDKGTDNFFYCQNTELQSFNFQIEYIQMLQSPGHIQKNRK